MSLRHGVQVALSGSGQGADGGTLINSFLQAAAGEESGEIAGGEAISGTDSVNRGDGKRAGPGGLSVDGPGLGALGTQLDHYLPGAGVQVCFGYGLVIVVAGQQADLPLVPGITTVACAAKVLTTARISSRSGHKFSRKLGSNDTLT